MSKSRKNGQSLRLHGTIARNLGIQIVSGHFKPGDLLEGEIESSQHLQVSRTAYREAVRILAAKGLVESRPKAGTKVSGRDRWHLLDPDVLAWIFANEPDDALLNGLFELRLIIEPAAAALAATRRSDAEVESMDDALQRMAEHTLSTEEGIKADQEFHATLLRASRNPFIISLISGIAAAVHATTMFKQRDMPLPRDPVPDHFKVFEAIRAGDAAGARVSMDNLIRLARRDTPGIRDSVSANI